MSLSEKTQRLLLSALGSPEARDDLITDIESIDASEIGDLAVTTAKINDLAVTTGKIAASAVTDAKVATGIDAAKLADGSVSNAEFQRLDGVTSAIQTQIDSKLASASFTDAAVTGKVLTGYVSGAGTVSATDTILQAINKLNGNNGVYSEATFTATFTQSVGAIVVVVRKVGKVVTLEIPTGTTADGGGGSIASGATDITAAYRPAADLSFPVIVTSNAAKVLGRLVVSSAGQLTFTASAAGGNFTDDATAGFDRIAISYTLA